MVTSSIFHNVEQQDPKDVGDFLIALEASEVNPYEKLYLV